MEHVEHTSDTANLETGTNLCGQLSLGAAEDDVQKFLAGGHRRNLAVKNRLATVHFGQIITKPKKMIDYRLTSFHVVFMMGHRSQN